MHTGWLAEDAFAAFQKHLPTLRDIIGANEQTTRLRAIDTLLFDVLRWNKSNVETEKYSRSAGYADYAFGNAPSFCLVLEAKREGASFILPEGVPSDRPVPFDLLARESKAAEDALRQASSYAMELGSPFIAISNGHQWILTLTFVVNKPLTSRNVRAFSSLDAIEGNFRIFWDSFSPLAITTNLPTVSLLESRFDPPPAKLSCTISNYPAPAERNVLRNALNAVIEPFWAEATQKDSDADFLRHCYIRPSERSDDFHLATELITQWRNRQPIDTTSITPLVQSKTWNLITGFTTNKPIVILGRVGFGKSIFLQYLRRIHAAEQLQSYIQIDCNFLDRPDTPDDVAAYIHREVDRQLLDDYNIDITDDSFARGVLNLDLQRFHRSSEGQLYRQNADEMARAEAGLISRQQQDKHSYLARALRHLRRGQQKSLAIFFDNLDRRQDAIQEAAFLQASAIARDWDALLFICLRPGTFQRSQAEGVLDAIAPRMIAVSPPRTDTMLRRRFQYAIDAISLRKSGEHNWGQLPSDNPARVAELRKAKHFFEICEDSFRRNRELGLLFSAVANDNARLVLQYVQQVIRSGHLNTGKMLAALDERGGYTIATHETLRALLYGDYQHYDPVESLFVNVFDLEHSEPREHFSRLLALGFLSRANLDSRTYGYRNREDVLAYLHALGYTGAHTDNVLRVLYEAKCIEGSVFDVPYQESGDALRITALGRYHVTELVRTFVYIDAVVVDTPIMDEVARRECSHVAELNERLARGRAFLRYLNHCSEELLDGAAIELWNSIHTAVERDITTIEAR